MASPSAGFPKVYILLLNYRGANDTLACLDSLRHLTYPNFQIVVIDNASPDDSVNRLQARLTTNPGEFHLIVSPQNLGFSGGNNLGIGWALRQSEHDAFIWLLNNDTVVKPETLTPLVREALKTGGLAGSLLLYPDGSYQQVGTRINWWSGGAKGYRESQVTDGMPVETLTGASMLIPFSAIRNVGLMDASFFLYFEDGEYSLRCARAGFPLTVATQSRVFHKEGATTGRKSLPTQYYFHRNRMRVLFMYASLPQKCAIGLYAVFRMLRSVVKLGMNTAVERSEMRASTCVQWLALVDFWKGMSGPCPHKLENLQ
ncbi:MAG: N-acetylglucosaminyl-diphospho-decaprenol L-rhamnosyltransferase [Vampirovibrio sp.]|jgi:GT2 family glycosyltransferase|nr:N-acetylglucosaminyl-diphospho-decaprenol L-rhamnosyltransferase [Vampirovibrio sp.]